MKRRAAFVLMMVLVSGSGALKAAPENPPNSCLMNPPPNCEFDPACIAGCDAQYPYEADPDANCECKLGCCVPLG